MYPRTQTRYCIKYTHFKFGLRPIFIEKGSIQDLTRISDLCDMFCTQNQDRFLVSLLSGTQSKISEREKWLCSSVKQRGPVTKVIVSNCFRF